ncbi:STE family protein kinase [Trichomonas vaginalis G3]|uniref:STE family protein kinase n=1 Tax=Trichomonas vaginalis (strain ATCC PRA-98 / G3) TaxID=412133 RepID=A2EN08_TRIV3|nr:stress-activated protein kinase signaling cascade [Trichomonas vaginalis G3]EAY05993.1 STE family protein kinase [Trichomonas vaginalis G3]KAI5512032.1 stress-activated protein kinase signaling cascade [Trichomonas vaginalis G3]|eukprot:XP_001318216.1 STE family protein kinase [Trichomonas vaginalis G3]
MSFPLVPEQYEILHQVGRGMYSNVYEAKCLANQQTLCVKIINLEDFPYPLENIQKQTSMWSKSSDPNIVQYYGSFVTGAQVWILTEFMDAGSLEDILKYGYPRGIKDELACANIINGFLKALDYFHRCHQIHRNVKSCNVLLNSKGEAKLSDFGLATSLIQGGVRKQACLSMFGDACYMSPEILKNGEGYTCKSDIWSFGLTVIEIATGKMPYQGMKFMESIVNIMEKEAPELPAEFSAPFRDFVKRCLTMDPQKRATSEELLNHRFLKNADEGLQNTLGIINLLPPLHERYEKSKPGESLTQQQPQPKVPDVQFDFDEEEAKAAPRRSSIIVTRKARDHHKKSRFNSVNVTKDVKGQEKVGRFSIHRISNGNKHDKSNQHKRLNQLTEDFKEVSQDVKNLQEEQDDIQKKIFEIQEMIRNYKAK